MLAKTQALVVGGERGSEGGSEEVLSEREMIPKLQRSLWEARGGEGRRGEGRGEIGRAHV